jgi:uncharacterized membrane protein (UPF0127 family)
MIKNVTRNKEIVENHHILKGVLSKGMGLMFRPKTKDGYIFEFDNVINLNFHTCFMFFNIDMIFLDENKRVVQIERNVKPYEFVDGHKFKYAIETMAHKCNHVQKGDIINWE